jgi:hypothetical protein
MPTPGPRWVLVARSCIPPLLSYRKSNSPPAVNPIRASFDGVDDSRSRHVSHLRFFHKMLYRPGKVVPSIPHHHLNRVPAAPEKNPSHRSEIAAWLPSSQPLPSSSQPITERSQAPELARRYTLEQLRVSAGIALRVLVQKSVVRPETKTRARHLKIILRKRLGQPAALDGVDYCRVDLVSHRRCR